MLLYGSESIDQQQHGDCQSSRTEIVIFLPFAVWSLATQESEETVIHFCLHPQNRGTDPDEGGRLGIRDPGDVFTIMFECIIINLTYSGSRKEKLWPGLKSKVR